MSDFPDYETDIEVLEEQDSGIWLSIGDLMSSLLMFFALLFITVQVQLFEKQAELRKSQQAFFEKQAELRKSQQAFFEKQAELRKYQQAFDELPVRILDALQGKMGGSGIFAVDPETGDVSLDDRILFDEGSAELKPEGKLFLKQFIPVYSQVIFSDNLFNRQITRVVIEGHTSSKGADNKNMELSLRRALSVSDYIFSNQLNFPTKQRFAQKILASGRGEIDAEQKIDNPSDRRVVFRFQFRREDLKKFLEQTNTIKETLKKN